MSRRKTEAQLKLQLQYAEARKAYTPPTREAGGEGKQKESLRVQYQVMSHTGTDNLYYTIRGAVNSFKFFVDSDLAELGLNASKSDGSPPKGFKPAKIHATKTADKGVVKHAKDSGRPYLSYQPSSSTQSSFSAPITSTDGIKGIVTKVTAIRTAKAEVLGPYGRIWFTPEFYVIVD